MPQLTWLGDHEAKRTARKVPYRLLDPVEQVGDPTAGNLLIQGDNLDALKALLPFYAGRVKCVFIDPPYNTKSAFEHYDDNLEHSQWLSMMYPRLELLCNLLSEDGSIWVTIGDNEGHYLKVLMDRGDRYSNDDSREKRDIGKVWAAASGGRCLYCDGDGRNDRGQSGRCAASGSLANLKAIGNNRQASRLRLDLQSGPARPKAGQNTTSGGTNMNVATWHRNIATWIFAGVSLLCLPAFAGPVEDIHEVEERRYQSMIHMDADALANTLADEFFYHQPNGKTNDKPGYIQQMMTGTVKIFSAERYDVKVNVYGDVATAMGGTRLDIEIGGERRKADLRYLNVWVHRDGRWQLAKRQSAFKQ